MNTLKLIENSVASDLASGESNKFLQILSSLSSQGALTDPVLSMLDVFGDPALTEKITVIAQRIKDGADMKPESPEVSSLLEYVKTIDFSTPSEASEATEGTDEPKEDFNIKPRDARIKHGMGLTLKPGSKRMNLSDEDYDNLYKRVDAIQNLCENMCEQMQKLSGPTPEETPSDNTPGTETKEEFDAADLKRVKEFQAKKAKAEKHGLLYGKGTHMSNGEDDTMKEQDGNETTEFSNEQFSDEGYEDFSDPEIDARLVAFSDLLFAIDSKDPDLVAFSVEQLNVVLFQNGINMVFSEAPEIDPEEKPDEFAGSHRTLGARKDERSADKRADALHKAMNARANHSDEADMSEYSEYSDQSDNWTEYSDDIDYEAEKKIHESAQFSEGQSKGSMTDILGFLKV